MRDTNCEKGRSNNDGGNMRESLLGTTDDVVVSRVFHSAAALLVSAMGADAEHAQALCCCSN